MVVVVLLLTFVMAGCQSASQGSKTYTRGQAQTAMQVYYGTVLAVADVTIAREESGAGGIGGAVVGGILGSTIGSGRGRKLATTGGALAGAAAGSAAEKSAGQKAGLEIEVELDDGRLMVIVQEKDDEFAVGDRVRIVQARDGTMRVRQ
jgi:outer membrane lipoprotein SlyB